METSKLNREITQENVDRLNDEYKAKLQAKLDEANLRLGKVVYPEYWQKRKKRLSAGFTKMIVDTAERKYEAVDDYGVYKPGTFLHKAAIVSVTKEDNLWSLHIVSEQPITLPIITEVRYKYLPNDLMMAMIFGNREENRSLKGVVLYQIPNNHTEDAE